MSTTRKILNQICLHHLPISNLYPDPFHHVFFQHLVILITLSTKMAILNQIDQFIIIPFSKLPIKRSTPSSPILKFIPLCNSPPLLSASDHFLDAFSSSLYSFSKFQSKDLLGAPHYFLFCLKLQLLQSILLFDPCPLLSASDHFLYMLFQHLIKFSYFHSKDNSQSNMSVSSPYSQSFPGQTIFIMCYFNIS